METLNSISNEDSEDEQWTDALDHIPSPVNDNNDNINIPSVPPTLSPPLLPPPLPTPTVEQQQELAEHVNEEVVKEDEEVNDDNANGGGFKGSTRKKQKCLSDFVGPTDISTPGPPLAVLLPTATAKKPKKKTTNAWTKSNSRKGKKKSRVGNGNSTVHTPGSALASAAPEDTVLITPIPRFPDKSDDSPESTICLSRVYKAEKVELSEDRLTAGSTKGYRMVRATRGVIDGAWYFEVRVIQLGETGHTRLGWSTEKGDLQAPVGYDTHSFGYRDIDGSKVHKAFREKYGEEGYKEGDVIGFYINLPQGASYAPKPPNLVWFKGQRYMYSADSKDEQPQVVPDFFFRNGVFQGIAFKDICGGRYYPAASMYTFPNQPNCEVRFNFGPNFEFYTQDFGDRPIPRPMIEVLYHGYDAKIDAPAENGVAEESS